MSFFLGVDAGGSKTEVVLADEAGAVLARATGPGANLRRTPPADLREILGGCLADLRRATALKNLAVDAAAAGFAGAGRADARRTALEVLAGLLPGARVTIVGDMEIALEAAVGAGAGVVLLAGTGSIAYGRNALGQQARAGGRGPLESDEGSGFDIGRQALAAVQRALNGRSPRTLLAGRLPAALGGLRLDDSLVPDRVNEIAELVPVVVAAAREGDGVAREILERSATALAELALAVLRKLRMMESDARVAAGGGVFAESEMMLGALADRISATAPRARLERLRVTPAEGAVRLAQRLRVQEAPR